MNKQPKGSHPMKNWLLGALVVALATSTPMLSEAKRLGSGKSQGMQRSAPVQPAPQTPPPKQAAPQQTAPTPAAAPAAAAPPAADAAAAQLIAAQSNRDVVAADLKRFQSLFEQGFISSAELERRQAADKAAHAQWRQAQAQSTVQGNQSNYTHLLADGSGVITSVDASAGQVVAAGQPVMRLALDGPRDVIFSVSEDKLASLKAGVVVDVRQWTDGKTIEAKVRDVSASADAITRTFVVKAALPKEATPVLGSTVTVSLRAANLKGETPRIKLPTSALRTEAGATSVWVLDPATMTVKSQPIQVTTADGNDAVVDSGLQNGDQVVLSGVHVLTAGQKVSIFGAAK
jgi:RND family efflux transporter MFP subunit